MKRIFIFIVAALVTISFCRAFAGDLPDPALTPGASRATTAEVLCSTSTKLVRHTSSALKNQVYARYGVTPHHAPECTGPSHSCYEVDHRVPLEDGGADVLENLWIQAYDGPLNAHMKDQLENFVHRKICDGSMSIADAQRIFLGNWIDGYKTYIGGAK